ncbi:hypothetical protein HAHE_25180 [Haloferula helveola]|uniref:GSKIP domain-containing protein n=1 Tax=Haloferula helveola TaxID=490095 RepID=A0ABN6H4M0_9BACT|nr:hypothetical protein HAHE_25180 [Haloferula helveola]
MFSFTRGRSGYCAEGVFEKPWTVELLDHSFETVRMLVDCRVDAPNPFSAGQVYEGDLVHIRAHGSLHADSCQFILTAHLRRGEFEVIALAVPDPAAPGDLRMETAYAASFAAAMARTFDPILFQALAEIFDDSLIEFAKVSKHPATSPSAVLAPPLP